MNEINEMFKCVINLKKDINKLNAEILRKKEAFEESIKDLNKELLFKKAELDAVKDYKVSVRFGDLVDELLELFNLDKNVDKINYNISTSISFYGKKSAEELIKLNNDSKFGLGYGKNYLYILLEGIKKTARYSYQPKSFMYSIFLPLDFEAIQADGKSLLDHSSVRIGKENNKRYSSIIVNKNVDDLILDIDLNTLMYVNKPTFYPADMFREAIGRCVEKENIKVKKRQP